MVERQRSPDGNTVEGTKGENADSANPGRMSARVLVSWALIGLSIAVGLSAAGLWLLQRQAQSPGRVEVIIPTPAPIVVHVSGAVQADGVYSLPPGSRIADVIDAAGGPSPGADLSRLNLAARAPDGARLLVPLANDANPDIPVSETKEDHLKTTREDSSTATANPPSELVDLNTAPLSVLISLPGIGEKRAEAIIAFRESRGPIVSPDDLLDIDGFGPATVENIRSLVAQSTAGGPGKQLSGNDSTVGTGNAIEVFVDLNTGSLSDLMSLPGIGESRAAAIIRYREQNGPIESADHLLEIDGIGQGTVDNIRPFVVQQ